MAQPQRGPVRTEVSDLRNIVDRLDLLMGSSADTTDDSTQGLGRSAREEIESALSELSHRVGVVERETEELRTLVNHLMTIATWQAKVTATLVGEDDDAGAPDEVPPRQEPQPQPPAQPQQTHHESDPPPAEEQQLYSPPPAADQHSFVDRVGKHMEPRGDDQERPRRHTPSSLDDDIDDILGTNREPSSEMGPPPDFGI